MNQIYLIILGAILALVTSFLVEIYKSRKDRSEQLINLKIILKLELKNTLQVIDRLIERYGSVSFYDYRVISQLTSSISRLETMRERIIYLKEDSKKEEVLSCINILGIFQSDVLALENQAFDKEKLQDTPGVWNDEYNKNQRQIFATRSVDVKRHIQDILNYLER